MQWSPKKDIKNKSNITQNMKMTNENLIGLIQVTVIKNGIASLTKLILFVYFLVINENRQCNENNKFKIMKALLPYCLQF